MKILFLCGCVEPGHDGTGDYTMGLALNLIQNGYKTSILALNDHHVEAVTTDTIESTHSKLLALRLPSHLSESQKLSYSQKHIQVFNPDWISLQFVSYSFHLKGLPLRLHLFLKNLVRGRQLHIMFHELWIGMAERSTLKHLIWGRVQKFYINLLIKSLNPRIIHTHTYVYQQQLKKLGYNPKYLPLFGNIPIHQNDKKSFSNFLHQNNTCLNFVVFGTIQPNAPISQFAKEARNYAEKTGHRIKFFFIGNCGNEQKNWEEIFHLENLDTETLGRKSVEEISTTFRNSSIGLATTSFALIGKSGSTVAMLEHGLPVICVSLPWKSKNIKNIPPPTFVFEFLEGNFEECIYQCSISNPPVSNRISAISLQLIADLKTQKL